MQQTKVKDIMTSNPSRIGSDETVQYAARRMRAVDCGVLLVGDDETLEGIITDRDIVMRSVSEGHNPMEAKVYETMSDRVYTCN